MPEIPRDSDVLRTDSAKAHRQMQVQPGRAETVIQVDEVGRAVERFTVKTRENNETLENLPPDEALDALKYK